MCVRVLFLLHNYATRRKGEECGSDAATSDDEGTEARPLSTRARNDPSSPSCTSKGRKEDRRKNGGSSSDEKGLEEGSNGAEEEEKRGEKTLELEGALTEPCGK